MLLCHQIRRSSNTKAKFGSSLDCAPLETIKNVASRKLSGKYYNIATRPHFAKQNGLLDVDWIWTELLGVVVCVPIHYRKHLAQLVSSWTLVEFRWFVCLCVCSDICQFCDKQYIITKDGLVVRMSRSGRRR